MNLLTKLCSHLEGLEIDWYICGGHAVDTYLGRDTRKHKDIDITIKFMDLKICTDYLFNKGWEIYAPVGSKRLIPFDYAMANSSVKFNNLWCFKKGCTFIKVDREEGQYKYMYYEREEQTDLDFIEILLNHFDDKYFFYRRNESIKREIEHAFLKRMDMSILAPELILLYKSVDPKNEDNLSDYGNLFSIMDVKQQEWFRQAMAKCFPEGHLWINK